MNYMRKDLREALIKQCIFKIHEEDWETDLCCQFLKENGLNITQKELEEEIDIILNRKPFFLKNNKGNKVLIDYLETHYKGRTRYLDSRHIANIEMYDNGYIKKIEWKDEEVYRISGTSVDREDKGILCYYLSDDDKVNLCLLNYNKDGKYYSAWLDLVNGVNCYFEYYICNTEDIEKSERIYSEYYIYVEDDWYNERSKEFPQLKEIKYMLPISKLNLRHFEMGCKIKGEEKILKFFYDENGNNCFFMKKA